MIRGGQCRGYARYGGESGAYPAWFDSDSYYDPCPQGHKIEPFDIWLDGRPRRVTDYCIRCGQKPGGIREQIVQAARSHLTDGTHSQGADNQ